MVDYRPTPIMTEHARQRAAEMGYCTKRIKNMLRNPSISHVTWDGRKIAMSVTEPDIAVVYAENGNQLIAITVLWRSAESYDRETFTPRSMA